MVKEGLMPKHPSNAVNTSAESIRNSMTPNELQNVFANTHEHPPRHTRIIYTKKSPQDANFPHTCAKKVKRRRNSDTSSEEDRWLTAIETGQLNVVDDELKKIKDPKLMTARQRAIYERTQDSEINGFLEELIALPSGYKEKEKPQTAEEIHKALLKSQKRKQQADERREKDKLKTMERLLKKQATNKDRTSIRNKSAQQASYPKMTYISAVKGNYVIVPTGYEFPLKAQIPRTPPLSQVCYVSGCENRKTYNCSTTKVPLCSLTCYRKNLLHNIN
ncbi:INO80 complex subunit B [Drosophila santomea]|uniref:INO80 complex subunit B n=1 Tax=Drosophila santomea TaxID=129105 RepID=UPI001954235B|nr:INO80 complex subunit B [Drosophila santomea]